MPRTPLVAGNWKLNCDSVASRALLDGILDAQDDFSQIEVAVMPSYPYLGQAAAQLADSRIRLGAQDVSAFDKGAYTGEVSAEMLKDVGCELAIVGHSERRQLFGDTDQRVAEKFVAAQRAGLVPILCLGEALAQREEGITSAVICRQLQAVLDQVGAKGFVNAVIAYEPVWAIGTGKTATPEQAQEVHALIRTTIAKLDAKIADGLRIVYGGSVKPDNAAELFNQQDIDGGLIGGASLQVADFVAICRAAG